MLFQTCGGCRASNYLPLLRKALKKAGYGHIPVISLNFAGIEKNPGFHINLPMLHRAVYALLYGDLLMTLVSQCLPYETEKGSTQALADRWVDRLTEELSRGIRYRQIKENYREMLRDFAALPRRKEKRVLVGIVGEIFVKFSPAREQRPRGIPNLRGRRNDDGRTLRFSPIRPFQYGNGSQAVWDKCPYGGGRPHREQIFYQKTGRHDPRSERKRCLPRTGTL